MLSAAKDQLVWLRETPPNLRFLHVPGVRELNLPNHGTFYSYFRSLFSLYSSRLRNAFDDFDIIYWMHWDDAIPELLGRSSVPMILHYGGQAFRSTIERLHDKGMLYASTLQIVSYSPDEMARFGKHAPRVRVIPFGKAPEQYQGYTGEQCTALIVQNNFFKRSESSPWLLRDATEELQYTLYGVGNQTQCLAYPELLSTYRTHRLLLYFGVRNVPYTLTLIEAMMTGTPVVSLKFGSIERYIEHEKDGFICNSAKEMNKFAHMLLNDFAYSHFISSNARKRAVSEWGLPLISKQWNQLFCEMMNS